MQLPTHKQRRTATDELLETVGIYKKKKKKKKKKTSDRNLTIAESCTVLLKKNSFKVFIPILSTR